MSLVVLMSGGIDSAVVTLLAHEDGLQVFPLFVDFGQLAANSEWDSVQRLASKHGLPTPQRMDISGFGEVIPSGITNREKDLVRDAFLPGRNAVLLLLGASYAYRVGASAVAIGLLDERAALFPDQTTKFVDEIERSIATSLGLSIRVLAPLITMSKGQVIGLALSIGLDLGDTHSCHLDGQRCGGCIACKELESYLDE